jgi:hypothetical protein
LGKYWENSKTSLSIQNQLKKNFLEGTKNFISAILMYNAFIASHVKRIEILMGGFQMGHAAPKAGPGQPISGQR